MRRLALYVLNDKAKEELRGHFVLDGKKLSFIVPKTGKSMTGEAFVTMFGESYFDPGAGKQVNLNADSVGYFNGLKNRYVGRSWIVEEKG